ncbi:Putative beta-barrel porin-2, OmpL-like. bbp2 [Flaviramulus basaltis]|uniref:Putative beta-barrel porin-2, OmpL-like. bbp2 n=1 Tax=Flaviramulus basaltis TaxID=369401 RepID=A0A1K2IE75_9FLAO|nr:outer membrane beta-barrel protein [Flaviramulus basaltis]SFZ90570.1 Putative beta-barrel porin-2, OmpL-like. bbp2 [Flaviramulus basaltis]
MKKIITLSMLFMACSLFAQEEETPAPSFNVSGSVDAYYRANFTAPNDEFAQAPGSSFANLPGFALGMANVVFSYEGEKAGFVADLVFGPRGTDAIFASPMYSATGNIVNQLYAYWNVSESVTLTMGNFNTFLGYEVISPTANFNYSTSYLFSYGPFSHTGLKADFALGEDFSLMLGVMNDTDLTEFNPTGDYAFGAQLGYSGQFLNVLVDPSFFEIDYTGGFDLSDDFFLGINGAYLSLEDDAGGFYGGALYPQYATSDTFTLGLRAEYFVEDKEFGAIGTGVEDSSVFAVTLTGSFAVDNLTIKPELRLDSASDDAFLDNDLMATKSLGSFVLAAIYAF